MDLQGYRDEVLMQLTGGVLEIEIDNVTLDKIINSAFREVQRYIATTRVKTIPFSKCIDLSQYDDISSISRIYRSEGYTSNQTSDGISTIDPMQASQWQLLSGVGNIAKFQDFTYNYASWNTLMQIRNTTSTDLAFYYDRENNKIYINVSTNTPEEITIEYVPKYHDISEIKSDYWTDILVRMSVALTKVVLGRIRSRYTQTNALWTQDGQTLLEEGQNELQALRQHLTDNSQIVYPID